MNYLYLDMEQDMLMIPSEAYSYNYEDRLPCSQVLAIIPTPNHTVLAQFPGYWSLSRDSTKSILNGVSVHDHLRGSRFNGDDGWHESERSL